nr:MAG TPA: hypothetical protein [Caudoviricetes sp.]
MILPRIAATLARMSPCAVSAELWASTAVLMF